jgi:excisionase family DNA binding protein
MSSNFTVKRICEQCEGVFEAKTTVTRFCSPKCNKRNYKLKKRINVMKDTDQKVQVILNQPIKDLQVREFLSVGNAAKLLSTSTKMIYRMINEGKLNAVNLSIRKTVIHRKEVDRLFEIKERMMLLEVKSLVKPKLKDSYNMAEAQVKFNISEKGLSLLIQRNKIPKFKSVWYTYVAKKDLDVIFNPVLK